MAFTLLLDGEACEIEILARRPHLRLRIDGRVYTVEAGARGLPGHGILRIDGETHAFARAEAGETQLLRLGGRNHAAGVLALGGGAAGAGGGADALRAPMPGVVVRLHKAAGDAVTRGETVLTIESMKLQTALGAPRDGVIEEILVGDGASFEKDAVLARLVSAKEE